MGELAMRPKRMNACMYAHMYLIQGGVAAGGSTRRGAHGPASQFAGHQKSHQQCSRKGDGSRRKGDRTAGGAALVFLSS